MGKDTISQTTAEADSLTGQVSVLPGSPDQPKALPALQSVEMAKAERAALRKAIADQHNVLEQIGLTLLMDIGYLHDRINFDVLAVRIGCAITQMGFDPEEITDYGDNTDLRELHNAYQIAKDICKRKRLRRPG